MRSFDAKHKSVYLSLTCGKQVIMEPVQRNMLTPDFCKPIFRNRKYLLRESLTVLSKLMHIISKKLSLFLHLHMKIRRRRLHVDLLRFEIDARDICGKFVYKHSETI